MVNHDRRATFFPSFRKEDELQAQGIPTGRNPSAERRRRIDQDEEQIVWIAHDADFECVGAGGQIKRFTAGWDKRAAGFAEGSNRRIDVRDAQLYPSGARVLNSRNPGAALDAFEIDQRELQARCRYL